MTWPKQDPNTLRLDAIGDVARPFELDELRTLNTLAQLVRAKKSPRLVFLVPVLASLRHGKREKRSATASKAVNQLMNVLAAALVFNALDPASCAELHACVRALSLPALDAFEDMLARYTSVRPLLEAERMWRAGLLATDWSIEAVVASASVQAPVHVRVLLNPRQPEAQA